MAPHFSVPAWRIPWTEEPGGLQSMGCKELDTTEPVELTCAHPCGLVAWAGECTLPFSVPRYERAPLAVHASPQVSHARVCALPLVSCKPCV